MQIPTVLSSESAKELENILTGGLPWRYLYTDENDQPVHFTKNEIQQRGQEKFRTDLEGVYKRARENRCFHNVPLLPSQEITRKTLPQNEGLFGEQVSSWYDKGLATRLGRSFIIFRR